jgi:uncharacterized protein (DUF433 family)
VSTTATVKSLGALSADGERLFGLGLYTVPETARLIEVPAQRIRRWLRGYDFRRHNTTHRSAPLWRPEVPEVEGAVGLSFLDLIELRLIGRFLSEGVSLHAVRRALLRAREVFGREHPFATRRFQTDGRTIFLETTDQGDEPRLFDLLSNQYAFRRFVAPSFKDIDFEGDAAARWWPLSKSRTVVLDPRRSFGQPIAAPAGVPTATLAAAVAAEGSVEAVASWFEVEPTSVRDALEFERKLAA